MIHDYKSSIQMEPQRRRGSVGWLAVAASILLGLGFAYRFVNLAEGHAPLATKVSEALPLPTPDLTAPPAPAANLRPDMQPLSTENGPAAVPAPATATLEPQLTHSTVPSPPAATVVHAPAAAPPADPTGTIASSFADDPREENTRWLEHHVSSGESLARIFKDTGLSAALLHRITHSSETAASLADIRPGQTLRVELDERGEFVSLVLQRDRLTSLRVEAQDEDGFSVSEERRDVDRRVASTAGVIESSLFADGQKAGLSDGQIMELAAIFGWDIDFALELRAGDQFSLVYEDLYLDGERLRSGSILAAEFVNRGTTYRAVRYAAPDGTVGYYDAEGLSKKRAFIRTPVKFSRISSGFTTNRWHPVLKRWRSHKGVDYAAPTGTPVKATGAGRVVFKGNQGGYGKVVMIEHAGKYTTVYGHLSQFAKRVGEGTRVKQGQVIGYVGQSGLATGPHLHYEFRVAGVHRDPLTVKLPKSMPLEGDLIKDFRRQARPLLARLDDASQRTVVAQASHAQTTATD